MLKKIGFIMIAAIISVTVFSCSGGEAGTTSATTAPTTASSSAATSTKTTSPVATTTKTTTPVSTASSSTSVPTYDGEASDIGPRMNLPSGYPSDLLPIYEGSYIINVVEAGDSYTITAYSKEDYKAVMAFYQEALAEAAVMADTVLDTSFTSFGTLGGYTYSVDVGKSSDYTGYTTSISIMIFR